MGETKQQGDKSFERNDAAPGGEPVDVAKPVESGWVIERGDSSTAEPYYWIGGDSWALDHSEAVRFARQVDAEKISATIGQGGTGNRVCLHEWA